MSIIQFGVSVLTCVGISTAFVLVATGFFYMLSVVTKKEATGNC